MSKQLDIQDVYPSAFMQTENNAELREERKPEGRERDGAGATGIIERNLVGNQVWKLYGMLKNSMENSEYNSARKICLALHLALEDLHKLTNR